MLNNHTYHQHMFNNKVSALSLWIANLVLFVIYFWTQSLFHLLIIHLTASMSCVRLPYNKFNNILEKLTVQFIMSTGFFFHVSFRLVKNFYTLCVKCDNVRLCVGCYHWFKIIPLYFLRALVCVCTKYIHTLVAGRVANRPSLFTCIIPTIIICKTPPTTVCIINAHLRAVYAIITYTALRVGVYVK